MTDEIALKNAITQAVRAYCTALHDFSFRPEAPMVRLHEPTFSTEEIMAALDCLLTTRVTMGPKVKAFEQQFAATFGWNHGVMNNSGSSANLLAISALTNPRAQDRLMPGDEVIVPALSWSTTIWPLIQCGLVPVIVDIDPSTLNIDPEQIERAIGPRTRAVMIVPVYGNPCDMDAIIDICHRNNLQLIEDCCEALGAFYDGKPVGRFGRVATFSFYYSHHITTLEGGICTTDEFELSELMRILRAHGWIREVDDPKPWIDASPGIDERFLFVNLGYNLRATELSGAMGTVQLPKLAGFVDVRRDNANWFRRTLDRYGAYLSFQQETPKGRHSWFGFPIHVKAGAPFTVNELMRHLNDAHIETRPIICGNVALQPGLQMYPHRTVGDLRHATQTMKCAFSFGNHQAIDSQARSYVAEKIGNFLNGRGLA
ncbi:MAG: aminotransferase class I/II-fold pyridoxal phosphate-dependent enzyme [Rhodospirillaceae bacterium]|nr:aminotransferase class I/II-fold pyridoxal phosphate-dependent enzyme [Rhodospirillaceae bacterium]